MKTKSLVARASFAILAAATLMLMQRPHLQAQAPASIDGLISQAKVAAGTDWSGTFTRLCIPPPPPAPRAAPAPASGPRRDPPRETWLAEPAKVGDNLYFLGTKIHSSWGLVGSDGIIVLEALFDYAVADEVVGGLRKMGLDPNKVRYAVMSHAHGDHDGGAAYLQDTMKDMHLVYGVEDWKMVASRQGQKPKHDMDGTDGLVLSVGDASIRIVTMPGHTAGTLSYLFEFKDNGKPIRVAYVGGTAIPFDESAAWYDTYIASSKKMAKAAADYGATALISNHTEFDNGYFKAHTAADRKERGLANPFDVGRDGVGRYFTVVERCAEAAKLRAARK